MAAKAPNPSFLPDEAACKVLVTHVTDRHNHQWPPQPIVNRLEVALDNRGTKWEHFVYRCLRWADDSAANWYGREQVVREFDEATIAHAEAMVQSLWVKHDKAILRDRRTWQYKLIAAEAKRLGWPTHFRSDLEDADAYLLVTKQPEVFLWSVRPTGTWLSLDNDSLSRRKYEAQPGVESDHAFYEVSRSGLRKLMPAQYAGYKFKEA